MVSNGTGLASNYSVTLTNGTLTVNAKALSYTIGNDSQTYGTLANLSLDLPGSFLTGVNGEDLTLAYASTGDTATALVGTYAITGVVSDGTGLASDYSVTLVPGTLTVTPASLTVSGITANGKVYDATAAATLNLGSVTLVGVLPTDAGFVSLNTGSAAGSFADKNAGTNKTVSVSGLSISGTRAGNYTLTTPTTTASITARPITVTAKTNSRVYDGTVAAAANSRVYDGTLAAAALPTITTGSLVGGDTPNFAETYNNKNVATSKTLTPGGSVNDGNNGNNYSVTFVTATTGVITARPITVTAVTSSRGYDGTVTVAAIPTVTGSSMVSGDVAIVSEKYDNRNVGSGKTLTPAGSISDGNAGNNYAVTFVNNTTGAITARTITVTAATNSRVYDGTLAAAGTPTITAGSLVTGDAPNFTETYSNRNVGTGKSLIPAGSVSDGNGGHNYSVTFVNSTNGVITAALQLQTGLADASGPGVDLGPLTEPQLAPRAKAAIRRWQLAGLAASGLSTLEHLKLAPASWMHRLPPWIAGSTAWRGTRRRLPPDRRGRNRRRVSASACQRRTSTRPCWPWATTTGQRASATGPPPAARH